MNREQFYFFFCEMEEKAKKVDLDDVLQR